MWTCHWSVCVAIVHVLVLSVAGFPQSEFICYCCCLFAYVLLFVRMTTNSVLLGLKMSKHNINGQFIPSYQSVHTYNSVRCSVGVFLSIFVTIYSINRLPRRLFYTTKHKNSKAQVIWKLMLQISSQILWMKMDLLKQKRQIKYPRCHG